MTASDPVTLAALKGRLEQIADEMDATLHRSVLKAADWARVTVSSLSWQGFCH